MTLITGAFPRMSLCQLCSLCTSHGGSLGDVSAEAKGTEDLHFAGSWAQGPVPSPTPLISPSQRPYQVYAFPFWMEKEPEEMET